MTKRIKYYIYAFLLALFVILFQIIFRNIEYKNLILKLDILNIAFIVCTILSVVYSSKVLDNFIMKLSLGLTRKELMKRYFKNILFIICIMIGCFILSFITLWISKNEFNKSEYLILMFNHLSIYIVCSSLSLLFSTFFDKKIYIFIPVIVIFMAYVIIQSFNFNMYYSGFFLGILLYVYLYYKITKEFKTI